ncbi:MAG: sensor histidine kinase, partial [Croceimicrobium sp.]
FAFYLGFFVIYLLLFWYLESDLINFSGMLKAAEQERLQVIVFNLLFLWVFANFWFYNRSTELYERDLEKALQKIEAKNEELEQFVHIASHDLQEPLQSITSFIEIAQQEEHKTREEELQYLDYMQVAAKRMRGLILALMNYSRIGRGQKPKQLTDLNQIALSLKTEFEKQWEEGELSIEVDGLPKLKVYAEELRILFKQLLSNAIKFREGGQARISISAQKKGDFFEFAFRDNGIGIAGPNAERVFAIFQRLNKQEDFEGLGVGLAYAKKIVDLHEGSIWFESQIGKGTTFYFTLKATENE